MYEVVLKIIGAFIGVCDVGALTVFSFYSINISY